MKPKVQYLSNDHDVPLTIRKLYNEHDYETVVEDRSVRSFLIIMERELYVQHIKPLGESAYVKVCVLYETYRGWCHKTGNVPLEIKDFKRYLTWEVDDFAAGFGVESQKDDAQVVGMCLHPDVRKDFNVKASRNEFSDINDIILGTMGLRAVQSEDSVVDEMKDTSS